MFVKGFQLMLGTVEEIRAGPEGAEDGSAGTLGAPSGKAAPKTRRLRKERSE